MNIKEERQEALESVKENGINLSKYIRYNDDLEIVLNAVKNNGLALRFASNILRANENVVRAAINQNPAAINFADYFYKNSPDFLITIDNLSKVIEHTTPYIRNSIKVMNASVKQDGLTLRFGLSNNIFNNYNIIYNAVSQNGLALRYAHISKQNCYEIVKNAVKQNGLALEFASKSLKDDETIVSIAYNNNQAALKFASNRIKEIYGSKKNKEENAIVVDNQNNKVVNDKHEEIIKELQINHQKRQELLTILRNEQIQSLQLNKAIEEAKNKRHSR